MIRLNIANIKDIDQWWTESVCSLNRRCDNEYFKYWNINKKSIVSSNPEGLRAWIQTFNSYHFRFSSTNEKEIAWKDFCNYMTGQYERVRNKFGPELLRKLDVKVCPYCNRQFINMVDGRRTIKAELDHFYPKSRYPYLALSFYNLIPSCSVCNHAKGEDEIDIHPYEDDFQSHNVNFTIDSLMRCLSESQENWNVSLSIEHDSIGERNIDTFALNQLYSQHKDLARDIVFRSIAYNSTYMDELKMIFRINDITDADIKRIILGSYTDKEDLGKRPFSKLTADIYNQISK